jgi:hypothetical protein
VTEWKSFFSNSGRSPNPTQPSRGHNFKCEQVQCQGYYKRHPIPRRRASKYDLLTITKKKRQEPKSANQKTSTTHELASLIKRKDHSRSTRSDRATGIIPLPLCWHPHWTLIVHHWPSLLRSSELHCRPRILKAVLSIVSTPDLITTCVSSE